MEIAINLEVENDNGELYEPLCSIEFENIPFLPATYWQPEEGGPEIECIIVAGIRCYDSADLRRAKVDTYGANFAVIIDVHLSDIADCIDSNFGSYAYD